MTTLRSGYAMTLLSSSLLAACQAPGAARSASATPVVLIPVANTEPAPPGPGCAEGALLIPAGSFTMGAEPEQGDSDEHPAHPVELSAFCIDRTEVTVDRYRACTEASAHGVTCAPVLKGELFPFFDEKELAYNDRFCNAGRDDRGLHPINCVDWHQAEAFCRWAGGLLPTEAQWEYAAGGRDRRRYPWGAEAPGPKLLNACGTECRDAQRSFGLDDAQAMYEAEDGFEGTAPVGSFPAGASPFELQDMLGNVWEWTADWVGPYSAERAVNPHGPEVPDKEEKVIRGISSWGGFHADYGVTTRGSQAPGVRLAVGGFRCVYPLE